MRMPRDDKLKGQAGGHTVDGQNPECFPHGTNNAEACLAFCRILFLNHNERSKPWVTILVTTIRARTA